jgi:hypothetical protein
VLELCLHCSNASSTCKHLLPADTSEELATTPLSDKNIFARNNRSALDEPASTMSSAEIVSIFFPGQGVNAGLAVLLANVPSAIGARTQLRSILNESADVAFLHVKPWH